MSNDAILDDPFNGDKSKLAVHFSWIVDWEFRLLERHRREVDTSLRAFMAQADEKFAEETEIRMQHSLHGVEQEAWESDLIATEYEEATKFLPRLQWNAQFLIAFATFEQMICKLADILQRRTNQLVSYRDLGFGFEAAHAYLVKVGGFGQTTFQSFEWNAVRRYKALRNCIAHTSGEFSYSADPGSLAQVLKQFSDWSLDAQVVGQPSVISLTPQFVERAIATMLLAASQLCHAKMPLQFL